MTQTKSNALTLLPLFMVIFLDVAGPLGYISIYVPLWTSGILCLSSFELMLVYKKLYG